MAARSWQPLAMRVLPPAPTSETGARRLRRQAPHDGTGSRSTNRAVEPETFSAVRTILESVTGSHVRSDADLILAAGEDPDAFRVLYDRYAPRIHSFFQRRTGDAEAALDLTAETFAQAWVGRRGFRDLADGSAGPWLFTIARRALIATVRKRRLERRALEQLGLERSPAETVQPSDRWLEGLDSDLDEALADLPVPQRRALELRVLAGLPYSAVASQLRCSSAAARIRVSRGLRRLRERLEMN